MKETDNSKVKGKYLFYIYSILFTIGPSFSKIWGQPISRIATLIVFPVIFALNYKIIRFWPQKFIIWITSMFVLKLIPFCANNEMERIIVEMVELFLPLVLISFVFYHDNKLIENVITIVIFTSAVLCIFGFVEEFTQFNVFSLIENYEFENPRLGTSSTYRWGIYRIEQGFNTALTYALYLAMCIGLTFYRFFTANNKLVYAIILFSQIINCIFTMSRGILFVLTCGIIGIVILNRKWIKIKNIVISILALMLFIVVFANYELSFFEGVNEISNSIISIVLTGTGGVSDDNSIAERIYFQSKAFEALENPSNLFFGVGEQGLRAMRTIDNEWLLEISGFGIFGLLSFILLMLMPLVDAVKKVTILRRLNFSYECQKQLIFYKCMIMTLLVYIISLYTVAQMEEARMFYLLLGISCFYNWKPREVFFPVSLKSNEE